MADVCVTRGEEHGEGGFELEDNAMTSGAYVYHPGTYAYVFITHAVTATLLVISSIM